MIQTKRFTKTIEDFTCDNCGYEVKGSGYTNHCPNCLWSKHVDINPGDRASKCGGMMKPTGLDNKSDVFYIIHKCQKCGEEKRIKAVSGDNFQKLIELSSSN